MEPIDRKKLHQSMSVAFREMERREAGLLAAVRSRDEKLMRLYGIRKANEPMYPEYCD